MHMLDNGLNRYETGKKWDLGLVLAKKLANFSCMGCEPKFGNSTTPPALGFFFSMQKLCRKVCTKILCRICFAQKFCADPSAQLLHEKKVPTPRIKILPAFRMGVSPTPSNALVPR